MENISATESEVVPIGVPIAFKSFTGYLHNKFYTGEAICKNYDIGQREPLRLLLQADENYTIESLWNGRLLSVMLDGTCRFDSFTSTDASLFRIKHDGKSGIYLISKSTGNVVRCESNGVVTCKSRVCGEFEKWQIEATNGSRMNARRLTTIGLGVAGGISLPLISVAAGALIPIAMSTFGTVVTSLGQNAAGGVAVTLQVASLQLVSASASTVGAAIGILTGSPIQR